MLASLRVQKIASLSESHYIRTVFSDQEGSELVIAVSNTENFEFMHYDVRAKTFAHMFSIQPYPYRDDYLYDCSTDLSKMILHVSYNTTQLIDLKTNTSVNIPITKIRAMAFCENENIICFVSETHLILFDAENKRIIERVPLPFDSPPKKLVLNVNNGLIILTATFDTYTHRLVIYDNKTKQWSSHIIPTTHPQLPYELTAHRTQIAMLYLRIGTPKTYIRVFDIQTDDWLLIDSPPGFHLGDDIAFVDDNTICVSLVERNKYLKHWRAIGFYSLKYNKWYLVHVKKKLLLAYFSLAFSKNKIFVALNNELFVV